MGCGWLLAFGFWEFEFGLLPLAIAEAHSTERGGKHASAATPGAGGPKHTELQRATKLP